MTIPITYNLRSLAVRRTTTLMTAVGFALTVAVLMAALALANGLRTTFGSSGHPLNVLVLRKGSTSELGSAMTREIFQDVLFKPGIARASESGRPMVSLEIVTVVNLPVAGRPAGTNVTLRGLLPVGIELRDLRLKAGRWFQAGRREIVVGRSIAARDSAAHAGGRLRFGKQDWEVVGAMDGGQSAVNNEIFGDLNQVSSDFNRPAQLSSVLMRAADASAVPAVVNSLNDDPRLNAAAQPEQAYYGRQTAAGAPLQNLGIFVSVIMAVGSSIAAMNTMYGAVGRRTKEIGTLRVLGFSRGSILASFLIESVLLAVLGGLAGCLLVLPLNALTTGIGNFVTLSEIAVNFRVSPAILLGGLVYAAMMGAAGGLFPARMAAKKEILNALRES